MNQFISEKILSYIEKDRNYEYRYKSLSKIHESLVKTIGKKDGFDQITHCDFCNIYMNWISYYVCACCQYIYCKDCMEKNINKDFIEKCSCPGKVFFCINESKEKILEALNNMDPRVGICDHCKSVISKL